MAVACQRGGSVLTSRWHEIAVTLPPHATTFFRSMVSITFHTPSSLVLSTCRRVAARGLWRATRKIARVQVRQKR